MRGTSRSRNVRKLFGRCHRLNRPGRRSPCRVLSAVLNTVGPRFGRSLQLLLSPGSTLQIPETRGHHSSVQEGGHLDPANWRPITLLCVDYKIVAKALGNRLLQVITSVVSPDQSCGIPGRSPAENVRLLLDVACYADQNNIGGAIVSLDQEKAFDRVEISFMMQVLERIGFGPSFQHWIGLLYTDVTPLCL